MTGDPGSRGPARGPDDGAVPAARRAPADNGTDATTPGRVGDGAAGAGGSPDPAGPDSTGPADEEGRSDTRVGAWEAPLRLWQRLRRAPDGPPAAVTGVARVDRRTKRLVKRLRPGEVAVIDHADLDRVAAESLIDAAPAAVVNASRSITGRYPNLGPLLLCQAGIPLVDDVGAAVMDEVAEGVPVTVDGADVLIGDVRVASGVRQTRETIDADLEVARHNLGPELERFAANTVSYIREEAELLTGDLELPDLACEMAGRHVLIVVRGIDYREDLSLLQRSGYLRDVRPVVVGVDGGADALLDIGVTPDIIIGDFDSVSERALRCGAELVVHGYTDGRAPGGARLDELGLPYVVFSAPGTSEDIAMLLAYEKGAELMVAVGTHNSMIEFLDKGRAGMASTFLVRMKVGSSLVDAKGVSRLYRQSVRTVDLLMLVVAALFTLGVVVALSEPVRLVLRAFWLSLFSG